jgi:hypothetical protein
MHPQAQVGVLVHYAQELVPDVLFLLEARGKNIFFAPAVGSRSRYRARIRVVLPDPDSPTTPRISHYQQVKKGEHMGSEK